MIELSAETIPSFHDGFFDGVWISPDEQIHLFLRTIDNEPFTIVLRDVKRMRLSNIKAGNIIFDVTLISPDQITHEQIDWVHELSDVKKDEQIAKLLASVREEGLKMLELCASYGAEGSVLYKSAQLLGGTTMNYGDQN